MAQSRVSERYAKALLDLANEQNNIENVHADMVLVKNAMKASSELDSLIKNPVLKQAKKQSIFKAIFGEKISSLSFKFLNLVISKRRESDLAGIANSFIQLYNNEKGITNVTLTTAIPVDSKTEKLIIDKIKTASNLKTIQLDKKVDPKILGGYIVEFNNRILDQSIQSNLNSIKRRFSVN